MKAKKVYEMIDPYASEETDAMDLDISYKKKLIEDWFAKWAPDADYEIDDDLNINIDTFLDLENSDVTHLPDNLIINERLDLKRSNIIKLPRNLTVFHWIDLTYTSIKEIPNDLKAHSTLDLSYSEISSLPDNLTIGENLILKDCKDLTQLPENLTVNGWLNIKGTKITDIPDSLYVYLEQYDY